MSCVSRVCSRSSWSASSLPRPSQCWHHQHDDAAPLETWQHVCDRLGHGPPSPHREALWRARVSVGATLAHALRRLPLPSKSAGRRRLVWLVGAREEAEGELARAGLLVEVLAALYPWPAGWEVWLCGPEMGSWSRESTAAGGAPLLVRAASGTLHELVGEMGGADEAASSEEQTDDDAAKCEALGGVPDAVALLNSGIGTLILPLVDGWLPTLMLLLRLRAPLLLSCFHSREAEGEAALLKVFEAHVAHADARNPFACPVAMDDPRSVVTAEPVDHGPAAEASEAAAAAAAVAAAAAAATAAGGAAGVSNLRLKWVCGSALPAAALRARALPAARALVRGCARLFGVTSIPAWIKMLNEGGVEAAAMAATLLAEAAQEPTLAALTIRHGGRPALAGALTRHAAHATPPAEQPLATGAAAGGYTGSAAWGRLVEASRRAAAQMDSIEAALLALHAPPAEAEAEAALPAGGRPYEVVWGARAKAAPANAPAEAKEGGGGAATEQHRFVPLREAPSLGALPTGHTLPPGARCVAVATRGKWIRVADDAARGWALTQHPLHGELLRACVQ